MAGVEVGKLVPPHSTWQVRPPDERRLTATNEPVCLPFKIRGENWRRDDTGEVCVAKAVNVLSLILAAAVRSQLLVVNPCAGLMLPSNRRAGDSS